VGPRTGPLPSIIFLYFILAIKIGEGLDEASGRPDTMRDTCLAKDESFPETGFCN